MRGQSSVSRGRDTGDAGKSGVVWMQARGSYCCGCSGRVCRVRRVVDTEGSGQTFREAVRDGFVSARGTIQALQSVQQTRPWVNWVEAAACAAHCHGSPAASWTEITALGSRTPGHTTETMPRLTVPAGWGSGRGLPLCSWGTRQGPRR